MSRRCDDCNGVRDATFPLGQKCACTDDMFQPWDSDHRSLVGVLWRCKADGLTLDDFDAVATEIMHSDWIRAVRAHAS